MDSSMAVNNEGRHPVYPGIVGASFVGETSYRGFYRFYKEVMAAKSWDEIRAQDDTWDEIFTNRDFWKNKLGGDK